jgi:hypothetical protein
MSGSIKQQLKMLGLVLLGVAAIRLALLVREAVGIFDAQSSGIRATITVAIPVLTVYAVWQFVVSHSDPEEDNDGPQKWSERIRSPLFLLASAGLVIIAGLNVWSLWAIWSGARIATREHPSISFLGWSIMLGLVLWLVLDRSQVRSSSAAQRAYNIWGTSVSWMRPSIDKPRKTGSFIEELTVQHMASRIDELEADRQRVEAERAAAKHYQSEGN